LIVEQKNLLESVVWGGSGFERCVYDFIVENVKEGSTVVEFGSGNVSTRVLGNKYKLFSVEHDGKWLSYPEYTTYIHAPIKDGWYDTQILEKKLPPQIDFLLVDGPSGAGFNHRDGLMQNLNIIKNCKQILFHDTWRPMETQLAKEVAKKLHKKIEFFTHGDYWAYLWN